MIDLQLFAFSGARSNNIAAIFHLKDSAKSISVSFVTSVSSLTKTFSQKQKVNKSKKTVKIS